MDRFAKVFTLDIPQGEIDSRHGGNSYRGPSEVHRAAIHLLPQSFGFQWVFSDQNLAKAAGNVVTERCINNRANNLGRSIRLSDPFQAGICTDSNNARILTARGLGFDGGDAENLAGNFGDLHIMGSIILK